MQTNLFAGIRVIFPEGFDERAKFELSSRGWISIDVEVDNGDRYALYVTDPVRLQQDLIERSKNGEPYFAEPGLVVLEKVTVDAIGTAVHRLWKSHYFETQTIIQPAK